MKTRILLIPLALLLVVSLAIVGCSESAPESEDVIELTFALFQPPTAALSVANTEFAQEIEQRTNGRVHITVHSGGSLLGGPDMYEGVRSGIADMGNGLTIYNPGAFPFTTIAELPVPVESAWAVSNAMYDFLDKYQPEEWDDVHILTTVGDGFNMGAIAMVNEPILTLEDWQGKTLRVVNPQVVTALGGVVKDIPMADVYDSLAKNILDGEASSGEPLKSWKLADVAPHITINVGLVQPSILWYNFMNQDRWESLPSDIQDIITEVSREYSGKLGVAWDDQHIAGVEYATSVGATIYTLSEQEAALWTEAILPVIDAGLEDLVAQGFSEQEVEEAWDYFQSRVEYWNGQLAQNDITPLRDRMQELIGSS